MEQMLREVEIECLPADIPSHIDADVSELTFGKVLRVADLPRSEKLKFLTDLNQPVAHVTSVKEEVVATPEAVAAEAGAVPAEPLQVHHGVLDLLVAVVDEDGAQLGVGAGLGALLVPVDRLELLDERDEAAVELLGAPGEPLDRFVVTLAAHVPPRWDASS